MAPLYTRGEEVLSSIKLSAPDVGKPETISLLVLCRRLKHPLGEAPARENLPLLAETQQTTRKAALTIESIKNNVFAAEKRV